MAAGPSGETLSREEVDDLMEQIKAARTDPELRAEIDREYDREAGGILSRGRLSGKKAELVNRHVDKYMSILGVDVRPDVRAVALPDWRVGGTTHWHPARPYTSVIRIQKNLLTRPVILENTIAHEMVHHRNNLAVTDDEIRTFLETAQLPTWWSENDGHGRAFQEGADRINAVVGTEYVTEKGATEEEKEEEARVSQAERTRANKLHLGKQVLVGLGGGFLAILALRRLFPNRVATPSSPVPTRPTPAHTPRADTRRAVPSDRPNDNSRGNYGALQARPAGKAYERGTYGRPRNA